MLAYGVAIFSGAFLLFQVQPLMGKYVLPWFGGAPGVWTTCMLFFQVLLLAGYGYAHISTRLLRPRTQITLHLVLTAVALLMLPITPSAGWKPTGTEDPTIRILALLFGSVGVPYFVLSATAPLLQSWYSNESNPGSPYRLYALSNCGSLLALVSFPVFFEAQFTRDALASSWSAGIGIYFLSCGWVALRVWRQSINSKGLIPEAVAAEQASQFAKVMWFLLPFSASVLLLAVTNKICQDVAVIPFLWVLPLAIYLLSFIISFESPAWYRRRWSGPLMMVILPMTGLLISQRINLSVPSQIGLYTAMLFVMSMVCHGEVYRLKPHPVFLTSFYLTVSAGGAMGGVFVAAISPTIFPDYYELHLGLLLAAALFLLVWGKELKVLSHGRSRARWAIAVAALVFTGWLLGEQVMRDAPNRVYRGRNFYGVLSVYRHELPDPLLSQVEMMHGRIAHGMQYLHPSRAEQPTLYFGPESGVGRAFSALPDTKRHIGVVGLGAGTLATYGRTGDRIRFYEINPDVEYAARKHFTFLEGSRAEVSVVIGDARLSLEREAPQLFDLLVLDAFSSDAIPIHLITKEAFAVYARHLKGSGVIAAHISNMSLDLEPVLLSLARAGNWTPVVVEQPRTDHERGILPSVWVLLSRDPEFAGQHPGYKAGNRRAEGSEQGLLWTDDYSALYPILRWPGRATEGNQPKTIVLPAQSAATVAGRTNLAETMMRLREELKENPQSVAVMNNLAVLLATAPNEDLRNGAEAVKLAERANEITGESDPLMLTTLAAAYAEAGRFDEAVRTAEKAIELAQRSGVEILVKRNQELLQYYHRHEAYHQKPQ